MADESTNAALDGVSRGLESLKTTLGGISQGLQNLTQGVGNGASAAMGGLGRMMPVTAIPSLGTLGMPRHGMYAQEMTFGRSMGTLSGYGSKPDNMSAAEMQSLAARDFGDRVAGGITMGGIYGAGMWASSAAMSPLFNAGMAFGGGNLIGMGGLMGGGMALGGMLAIPAVAGKIAADVQEHAAQTAFIRDSSFRYAYSGGNVDKTTGSGFSRDAASRAAFGMKHLAIEDLSLDSGDIQGILAGGTQMNLFRGADSPEKLISKMKDLTSSVKKMASALHVSLSEATKMMGELDQMGITSPADVGKFLMRADTLGLTSGKTAGEMASIGMMGAEMVRGTGLSMTAGAGMLQANVAAMTSLQASGKLSDETVNQAGGLKALSQGISGAAVNSLNSPFMRTYMGAMSGADGHLDVGVFNKMAGGADAMSMMGTAAGRMQTPGQFMSAFVNADKIKMEMSQQMGGAGAEVGMLGAAMGIGKMWAPYGIDKLTATKYVLQTQMGMTQPQIEGLLTKVSQSQEIYKEQMEKLHISSQKAYSDIAWEQSSVLGRVGKDVSSAWHGGVIEPVAGAYQRLAGSAESIGSAIGDWSTEAGLRLFSKTLVKKEAVTDEQYEQAIQNIATGRATKLMGFESKAAYSGVELEDFKGSQAYRVMMGQHSAAILNPAFEKIKTADEVSQQLFKVGYAQATQQQKMFIAGATRFNEDVTKDISKQEQSGFTELSLKTQANIQGEIKSTRTGMGDVLWQADGTSGQQSYNIRTIVNDPKKLAKLQNFMDAKLGVLEAQKNGASAEVIGDLTLKEQESRNVLYKDLSSSEKETLTGVAKVQTIESITKFKAKGASLSELGVEATTIDAMEKAKTYLDKYDKSTDRGVISGANAIKLAIADPTQRLLNKEELMGLAKTDEKVREGILTMKFDESTTEGKRKNTAAFVASLARQTSSKNENQGITGDQEANAQMQAVTESFSTSAATFKATADAMSALASQLTTLSGKITSETGVTPTPTTTTGGFFSLF